MREALGLAVAWCVDLGVASPHTILKKYQMNKSNLLPLVKTPSPCPRCTISPVTVRFHTKLYVIYK